MKILIADDNDDAREILKKTLEPAGYQVKTASHGKEALAMAKATLPDMIVSDILMPEMDGFQFCREIKSDPKLKKIPFIFYTANYLDSKNQALGFSLGASRYLIKPIESVAFLKIIHEVIREYKTSQLTLPEKSEEEKLLLSLLYEESLSKKLQEKIEELRLYKNVFIHSKDAIAFIDLEGRYLEQNPAHHSLIQYSDEELKGKTPAIHLGEEAFAEIGKQLSEKGLYRGEVLSRTKSGHKIDLELSAFPIMDHNGKVSCYVGIKRDITERKQAERLKSDQHRILELISKNKTSQTDIFETITRTAEAHSLNMRASILLLKGSTIRHGAAPSMPEAYNTLIEGLEIGPAAGSCGTAMFRKARVVVEDVRIDPLWADFSHLGEKYGFRACWSEPILGAKGKILGSFALYHQQEGPPNDSEIHLIEAMSHLAGITLERKQAEAQINTLFQAIEQSPVSVMITDSHANIEYVNGAFEKISGYPVAEVLGRNPRFLKPGNTPGKRYKKLWQAITRGKSWEGELQNKKKNGEIFWEYAHIAPVLDETGVTRHYLSVTEDMTLRKQQEEELLHQAHFDTLTGLPNRFLSLDRLSQRLKAARRSKTLVAVLFLDLDDFKKVNDTLGHATGDRLLFEVAERLRHVARSGDTVGRLGGDEFIILLSGFLDATDIRPVLKTIMDQFQKVFKIDDRELILTVSVGIAIFPGDGNQSSELLRCADMAMYHAKGMGRNTYAYFTDAMTQKMSRRLSLEEQMHAALDRGEFTLSYQPQIDLGSGGMPGAEALLRWTNPALGTIAPMEFIPIAEKTGLIIPLGKFVLSEALSLCSRIHQKHGPGFRMALNCSPRQFRDPDLLSFIEKKLDHFDVSGKCLELEITEGVLMTGDEHIHEILAGLKHMGVTITMDDFGTGYSSLSYLRAYPFDVLKIDQSFVRGIASAPSDRALIDATIAMAHGLNLKVVAEGVETNEQLRYLKKQGCDTAQGYLFTKPLPGDELLEWVMKREKTL